MTQEHTQKCFIPCIVTTSQRGFHSLPTCDFSHPAPIHRFRIRMGPFGALFTLALPPDTATALFLHGTVSGVRMGEASVSF